MTEMSENMRELERYTELAKTSGPILTEFWDWFTSQGFELSRIEQVEDRRPCPARYCQDGKVEIPNPDPRVGWTTDDLPEKVVVDCDRCLGKGYFIRNVYEERVTIQGGPEDVFCRFFGIDKTKVDLGRRELLARLQESTREKQHAE